jgi:hypothetical protein
MILHREIPPARAAKLQRLLISRSKKTKVSISVSADLVAAADELAGKSHRSELFERGIRSLMRRVVRRARHERELALLDKRAESLNAAAADSLEFSLISRTNEARRDSIGSLGRPTKTPRSGGASW